MKNGCEICEIHSSTAGSCCYDTLFGIVSLKPQKKIAPEISKWLESMIILPSYMGIIVNYYMDPY